MRALSLLIAAVLLLLPIAGADEVEGGTVGLNLGLVAPGVWDAFDFATSGGAIVITLDWEEPGTFPFADYDLRLYRPGSLADGDLSDNELMAESSQHPYAHAAERIDASIAPGTYVVAVAPFQAQMETYTLTANPGTFGDMTTLVGFQYFES